MSGFKALRNFVVIDEDLSFTEREAKFVLSFADAIAKVVCQIQQETRGQALNNSWYFYRVGRISSSRSHQVTHLQPTTDRKAVMDNIFGCTQHSLADPFPNPTLHTLATAHGQKMEPVARREYIQLMKKKVTL